MVHALTEAHRVLKPQHLLLDLRPAPLHRRVGLLRAGRFQALSDMREDFTDDHAANRAVDHVLRAGLFSLEARTQFQARRQMDTLAELRAWLTDFPQPHDWLIPIVAGALAAKRARWKIVVTGPVVLQVLRRVDAR